jgi:hypothetical protein
LLVSLACRIEDAGDVVAAVFHFTFYLLTMPLAIRNRP